MPALSPVSLLSNLITRDATTEDSSSKALRVICAWPVSGQYGPGSRVLYYALVANCILARKAEWIRGPCIAGALLVPAVAALHGIVLAASHIENAVDMDVYGAFQLCAIGILAAPATVRTSRTYFNNPGRNTIFAWSILILAGLLSLTVEFYRIDTSPCRRDDNGNPISSNPDSFPYGKAMCNLVCTNDDPTSPLRGGASDNIFVIPAPDKLGFGTATLLTAACCIPAILLLVSMWLKILELNWKTRFRSQDENLGKMKETNKFVAVFRQFFEIPLFAGAVLAILVIGESNLFSHQVRYQTEPLANVGQWAPIVGTGLAVLGSGYLLLAEAMDEEAKATAARERSGSNSDLEDTSEHAPILRRVARALNKFTHHFDPAHERFDDTEFQRVTRNYPQIPGEEARNRELSRIRSGYSERRDSEDSIRSGLSRTRSRTGSFRSTTSETRNEVTTRKRKDTLEVPTSPTTAGVHSLPRNSLSDHEANCVSDGLERVNSPTIVISPDADQQQPSPEQTPDFGAVAPSSSSTPELRPLPPAVTRDSP